MLAGLASATGLTPVLSGCGGGDPDDDARLRAVNATVDVANIDVEYNDWLFAGGVAHGGTSSGYSSRRLWSVGPRGRFEVRRVGSSTPLLRQTESLPKGDTASVVVMGNIAAGLRLRVVDEDAARPAGAAVRMRVLHAWPLVGALDVFITRADQPLAGRAPTWDLGGFEELSVYADASADGGVGGNDAGRLRITPRARTDLVLFDCPAIRLGANEVATLVVAPAPGVLRCAVAVLPQGLPAYVLVNTVVTSQHGEAQ